MASADNLGKKPASRQKIVFVARNVKASVARPRARPAALPASISVPSLKPVPLRLRNVPGYRAIGAGPCLDGKNRSYSSQDARSGGPKGASSQDDGPDPSERGPASSNLRIGSLEAAQQASCRYHKAQRRTPIGECPVAHRNKASSGFSACFRAHFAARRYGFEFRWP